MKQIIKKELKFYGRKVTTAFVMAMVFVAVAGTSIWALAAFTEPTAGPSSSVQDFAKNIMGANSSDNDFDSSSVTANSDGSVIERLESLGSGDYATCVNVYSLNGISISVRPACPNNFVSVADGYWNSAVTSTSQSRYTGWRACCVPK